MNLTPEQLEQCRKEFEKEFKPLMPQLNFRVANGEYTHKTIRAMWYAFQAAWHPIPSVEEMTKIMVDIHKEKWRDSRISVAPIGDYAQAIRRAFGGQDE